MWSPANIAKVGLDSSDGEEDRYLPPLSQSTKSRSESAVEPVEKREGGNGSFLSRTPPPQVSAPQKIETGVTTDEAVQGREDNTKHSLTLEQADTPIKSETVEREGAENIPAVLPTTPPRTQSDESEEAVEIGAQNISLPRTVPSADTTSTVNAMESGKEDEKPPRATANGHTKRETADTEDPPVLSRAATPQNFADKPEEVIQRKRRENGESSPLLLQTSSSPINESTTAAAERGTDDDCRTFPPREKATKSEEGETDGAGDAESLSSSEPRREHTHV